MAKFNLQKWMSENREIVIAKYDDLQNHEFFNGITLKAFMTQVMDAMVMNRVAGEKTAIAKLPFLMGNVYFQNSKIDGREIGKSRCQESFTKSI